MDLAGYEWRRPPRNCRHGSPLLRLHFLLEFRTKFSPHRFMAQSRSLRTIKKEDPQLIVGTKEKRLQRHLYCVSDRFQSDFYSGGVGFKSLTHLGSRTVLQCISQNFGQAICEVPGQFHKFAWNWEFHYVLSIKWRTLKGNWEFRAEVHGDKHWNHHKKTLYMQVAKNWKSIFSYWRVSDSRGITLNFLKESINQSINKVAHNSLRLTNPWPSISRSN